MYNIALKKNIAKIDLEENFFDVPAILKKRYKQYLPGLKKSMQCFFDNSLNDYAPCFIYWRITMACNAHCGYCYQQNLPRNDLSLDETVKIAHKIGQSKSGIIALTGGEPFVKKNIKEILQILTFYKKFIMIETNGLLLENYLDVILKTNVEIITISIDSHLPQLNDQMRGKSGYWEKAMRAIKLLKKERKHKKPRIYVRGVITKNNYQHLEDYISFFIKKVDRVCFMPVRSSEEYTLNVKDANKLRLILRRLGKKYPDFAHSYYQLMPDYIISAQRLVNNNLFRCISYPTFILSIKSDGEICICPLLENRKEYSKISKLSKLGNIKNITIEQAWKNKKTFLLQQFLKSKHCKCICWCAEHRVNTTWTKFISK